MIEAVLIEEPWWVLDVEKEVGGDAETAIGGATAGEEEGIEGERTATPLRTGDWGFL